VADVTAPDPAAAVREALEWAAHVAECGTTHPGHESHLFDVENAARKALAALAALEAERAEYRRVIVECQQQIRERDDTERRDNHLRQLADEECVRADAMFERAVAAERERDELGPLFVRDACRVFGVDENDPYRMDKLMKRLETAAAAERALRDATDARLDYLRLERQTRRLVHFATAVNENVMGNGLAYRRDALRTVIGETEHLLAAARAQAEPAGEPMPCGHPASAVVSSGEGTAYCGACEAGEGEA
jgi:hypothetical protein